MNTAESELANDLLERVNCQLCGESAFIRSVDRGTNGFHSYTISLGCRTCKDGTHWVVGNNISDAFDQWWKINKP
jgi:hypothetical protein